MKRAGAGGYTQVSTDDHDESDHSDVGIGTRPAAHESDGRATREPFALTEREGEVYACVRACSLQETPELDSKERSTLNVGDRVLVVEGVWCADRAGGGDDRMRLHALHGGWVSLRSSAGEVLLERVEQIYHPRVYTDHRDGFEWAIVFGGDKARSPPLPRTTAHHTSRTNAVALVH